MGYLQVAKPKRGEPYDYRGHYPTYFLRCGLCMRLKAVFSSLLSLVVTMALGLGVDVIEHFYSGYETVQGEMCWAIRTDAYLFLTRSAMSRLRRQKAGMKRYPLYKEDELLMKNFYQFTLDPPQVIDSLKIFIS